MEGGDGLVLKKKMRILFLEKGEREKHKIFSVGYHNERNLSIFYKISLKAISLSFL